MTKPDPLGIEPRFIWVERRRDALLAAMARYQDGKYIIPVAWAEELAEHLRWLEERTERKQRKVLQDFKQWNEKQNERCGREL